MPVTGQHNGKVYIHTGRYPVGFNLTERYTHIVYKNLLISILNFFKDIFLV